MAGCHDGRANEEPSSRFRPGISSYFKISASTLDIRTAADCSWNGSQASYLRTKARINLQESNPIAAAISMSSSTSKRRSPPSYFAT